MSLESAREGFRAFVRAVECNLEDRTVGPERELVRRAFQAAQLDVLHDADAEQLPKLAMEVIWRKRRDAAQTINVEFLMKMCIDVLEYFEQASLIAVGVVCGHNSSPGRNLQ
jgi:hypothetical protein